MKKDPYRYFRIEARELLEELQRGFMELEKGANQELVRGLLRQAHTLKGAARVVKEATIGDLAHRVEELLTDCGPGAEAGRDRIDAALELLDEIRGLVSSLGAERPASGELEEPAAAETTGANGADLEPAPRGPGAVAAQEPGSSGGGSGETAWALALEIAEMDLLFEHITAAISSAATLDRAVLVLEQARALARELAESPQPGRPFDAQGRQAKVEALVTIIERAHGQLAEGSDGVVGELAGLRDTASELRLVPFRALITDLERAARDEAKALGKRVSVRARGTETRIDAHVLSSLRGALRHVVRNAVAHGIEDERARSEASKAAEGLIEVAIERRGHSVVIACRDDGRGLDFDAVRSTAVQRGLVSKRDSRSLGADRLTELLLGGGLSTSRTVTDLSGRGVGLDAVRAAVEHLKGRVDIHSRTGEGTTVEMVVPISLASMPALAVEADGATALLPLDSVTRVLRFTDEEVARSTEGEGLVVDGDVVPFVSLHGALGRPHRPSATGAARSAVVIAAGGARAAVGVDRLGGTENVVVLPLPDHLAADPLVGGAALDESGSPRIVLAPAAVVQAASSPGRVPASMPSPTRPPLLVIDDSLTTRMLEQSILESAGYEVDLATSGEEALRMAAKRHYGLFIVDIEMPGMDGFELISRTREDPALREVPAVLVTSRSDPADRRRGKEVGARAYIVKSEFDQQELLETIRRLVG